MKSYGEILFLMTIFLAVLSIPLLLIMCLDVYVDHPMMKSGRRVFKALNPLGKFLGGIVVLIALAFLMNPHLFGVGLARQ